MPNWCINKIKITYTNKEELKRFKENVLDEGFDFEKIIPYPIDAPLKAKKEHDEKNDIFHTNEWTKWYSDIGYHCCSQAWGTKWNHKSLDIVEQKNGFFKISFRSAWNPPYGIYMRLRNRYPNLNINWIYYDEEDGFKQGYILDDKESIDYDEQRKETLEQIKNGTLTLKNFIQ